MPKWFKGRNSQEVAGIALDGETAFMTIQYSIPVETINEDKSLNTHGSSDSDDDSGDTGPPELVPKGFDLQDSSSNDESSIRL